MPAQKETGVPDFKEYAAQLVGLMGALKKNHGGGERDRTDDLLRAKQALSQLSYTPTICLS